MIIGIKQSETKHKQTIGEHRKWPIFTLLFFIYILLVGSLQAKKTAITEQQKTSESPLKVAILGKDLSPGTEAAKDWQKQHYQIIL